MQDVLDFPADGNRYEVVHGELLVTPAPRPQHQAVIAELVDLLRGYLKTLGRKHTLFTAPADIAWDDETLVQPDILIVPPGEVTNDWRTYKTLLLAVEVISPSSARADRVIKRRLYQENHVATYWVVDADARVVEIWHPGDERPEIATETLQWRLEEGAPELDVLLGPVFEGLPQ
ncbi:MAG TPA: Uma2 family endonuclease [Gemmatimonadaceae bacterium]|nr:Uma2 family endonuclease [Gemmatimonadaceae bacterium]